MEYIIKTQKNTTHSYLLPFCKGVYAPNRKGILLFVFNYSLVITLLLFSSCTSSYEYEYLYRIKMEEATKKHLSGNYQEANLIYQELLNDNKNPQFRDILLLNLANLYFASKNPKQAILILTRLLTETKDANILGGVNFALANYYFDNKQFNTAKSYIVNTLKYPDKFYSLYIALQLAGKISYYTNDVENMQYYFAKLAKTFSDDPYSQKIISLLDILLKGKPLLQLGKFSSFENGKNMVTKLSILGYDAMIKEVKTPRDNYFLVLTSCETQQLCRRFKEELNKIEVDAIEIP